MEIRTEELEGLLPDGTAATGIVPLAGDGSTRRFYRVLADRTSYVLMVGPDEEENAAWVRLAGHLLARGVRVPRVHGVRPDRGWALLDDLGDRNLYRAVQDSRDPEAVAALYRPVLRLLARYQVRGREGYRAELAHFHTPYDARLMVEEEGMYFAREFAAGLLGLSIPRGYRGDVERLAALGECAPAGYLLHRDFQSRNIHLTEAGPAAIDFQGSRFGPLAYDAAALLLDPYVGLSRDLRQQLLDDYRAELGELGVPSADLDAGWFPVGACRLLQALGAFGKLGGRFGKTGFLEHAATGLDHLLEHLGERGRGEFPVLWETVVRAREAWAADARRP